MAESEIVWFDPKTPKICATCVNIAMLGDGEYICLRQSSVKNPFLFHISPYNNASACALWEKGSELDTGKSEKKQLTPEDIRKLAGDKLS